MSSSVYESIIQTRASVWGSTASGKAVVDSYWIHELGTGSQLVQTQLYSDSRNKSSFGYTAKVGDLPYEEEEILSQHVYIPIFDDIDFSINIDDSVLALSVCSNTVNANGVKHQGHLKVLSPAQLHSIGSIMNRSDITDRFQLQEKDIIPNDRYIEAANKGSLSCVKEHTYKIEMCYNQALGKVNVLSPNRNVHEWLYSFKPNFNQVESNNRTVNSLAVKSLLMSAENNIMPNSQAFVKASTDSHFKLSLWLRVPKVLKQISTQKLFKVAGDETNKTFYLSIACIPNHNSVETALNITVICKHQLPIRKCKAPFELSMMFSDLKEPYNIVHDPSYPQRIVHALLETHTSFAQVLCNNLQEDVIIYTLNNHELTPGKLDLGERTLNYSEDAYKRKYFLSKTLECLPSNTQTMSYLDSIQIPSWKIDFARGEIKISPQSISVVKSLLKLDLSGIKKKESKIKEACASGSK
uniref:NSs non-structural protein n=1 Tax=Tomato spotted wilt virus TaxID=3052585 RepID=E1Y5E8_TSWV|nr:NSs non-structural protein [Orthotospovirus tomatomaculae]CBX23931.1 NSs non-structural protein [Orthotospovirus tomatomaculae]